MMLSFGNRNLAVFTMQVWLNISEGLSLAEDGIFGAKTQAALVAYQKRKGQTPDGIFKRATFITLREDMRRALCGPNKPANHLAVVKADKLGGGTAFFNMRADAAVLWNRIRDEVKQYGANLTSVGALRHLKDAQGVGRSKTSLHFAAIAHDFALDSGGINPETDNFVLTIDKDENWTIFARCTDQNAPKFDEVKPIRIFNPITYQQRNGTGKAVEGKFINVTAIAAKHGFYHVKPHRGWKQSKAITVLEWHHLDTRNTLLMQGFSSFQQEISTIWQPEQIKQYPDIARQDGIFGISWFG